MQRSKTFLKKKNMIVGELPLTDIKSPYKAIK